MKNAFALVTTALAFTGCSAMSSNDIKSSGIVATSSATTSGATTTCETTLQAGGQTGTYIELDGADALYCNGTRMSKSGNPLGQFSYKATVPTSPRALYEVRFERTGETLRAGALMPSAITGAILMGGNVHGIGTRLNVSWDRSQFPDEEMVVMLVMTDANNRSSAVVKRDAAPEAGSVTFEPDDTIMKLYNSASGNYERVTGPYKMELILTREKGGSLDGAWRGSMKAAQRTELSGKLVE